MRRPPARAREAGPDVGDVPAAYQRRSRRPGRLAAACRRRKPGPGPADAPATVSSSPAAASCGQRSRRRRRLDAGRHEIARPPGRRGPRSAASSRHAWPTSPAATADRKARWVPRSRKRRGAASSTTPPPMVCPGDSERRMKRSCGSTAAGASSRTTATASSPAELAAVEEGRGGPRTAPCRGAAARISPVLSVRAAADQPHRGRERAARSMSAGGLGGRPARRRARARHGRRLASSKRRGGRRSPPRPRGRASARCAPSPGSPTAARPAGRRRAPRPARACR